MNKVNSEQKLILIYDARTEYISFGLRQEQNRKPETEAETDLGNQAYLTL